MQALQTTVNVTVSNEELTGLTNSSRHNETVKTQDSTSKQGESKQRQLKNRQETSLRKRETHKPRVAETVIKEMRTRGLK